MLSKKSKRRLVEPNRTAKTLVKFLGWKEWKVKATL
jgi:hypothetical protein